MSICLFVIVVFKNVSFEHIVILRNDLFVCFWYYVTYLSVG